MLLMIVLSEEKDKAIPFTVLFVKILREEDHKIIPFHSLLLPVLVAIMLSEEKYK
jgi:hypothetical protein